MGFGDAAGPCVSLAKEQFHLTNFAAQLVPFAGLLMFGILSVPMGVYQDLKGKKFILMLGLCIMLAGLLIPPLTGLSTFPVLLMTMLLLGAGATTLQVSGNPIMRDVSPPGKYSRNLSLAQFVKAIGSLSGPLIPVIAARAFGASRNVMFHVMFPLYSAAVIVALLVLVPLRVHERKELGHKPVTFSSCLGLLRNGYVAMMVAAIFLYVGAEVSVSSGIPLYWKERFLEDVDVNRIGLLGTGLFFFFLTIGRFSGGVILNWMKPKNFLVATCALSGAGLLGMFLPAGKNVAIASVILIGLGFANVFPLIFSIVVDSMPDKTNALSGLMVMAIIGGAVVPPVMGLVADALHSTQMAFGVPLAALLCITWAAVANWNRSAVEQPL